MLKLPIIKHFQHILLKFYFKVINNVHELRTINPDFVILISAAKHFLKDDQSPLKVCDKNEMHEVCFLSFSFLYTMLL
jgi:hypothetical protein